MNNKEFSVLMCVYYKDNPNSFEEALESIINQTVIPKEINIVCDGPLTDKLYDIINKYKAMYSFVNVYEIEKNVGHGNARRYGIQQCKYNIVALMDSDDISVKDRFEKQLKVFNENPNIHVVGGQIYEFINNIENIVGKREVPELDSDIKKYMKKRCPMNQVTVMFDKKAVVDSGNYIDWYCEEDYYLWIRMAQHKYNFYNIPSNLVFVRVGDEMYNRRGGFKYYQSEEKVQRYMLENKIIAFHLYLYNITIRFIIQILLPNKLRGFVFRTLARKKLMIKRRRKIMDYLLYEHNKELKKNITISEPINIIEFTPRLFKLYWESESKSLRTTFFRLYISILTKNKTKIYFALNKDGKIVHTSYTICKNFKYPFMNKGEIVIGPCNTEESARGKGIYPFVLNHIINNTNNKSYYLIIRPENTSSIHGAKKAGFALTDRKIIGTKKLNRFIEIKK